VRSAAWPTGSTRLLALLGWPATYSVSPQIHNAALAHCKIDMAYVVLPCPAGDLPSSVRALANANAGGANVTIPHKQAAVSLCDVVNDEVRLVGAVNTLTFRDGQVYGYNTDVDGLADDWNRHIPADAFDQVVVFGTGGAARAVVVAAARRQASLTVVGRRVDAVDDICALALKAGCSQVSGAVFGRDAARAALRTASLVVNATPLGMTSQPLPDEFRLTRQGQFVHDLVYTPSMTELLAHADAAGATIVGGRGMLVGQAARSFELFTGQPAPMNVMDQAARAALTV